MRDRRKVTVTLTDGKTGITTVHRLRRAFLRKSAKFQENFFYHLLNDGEITTYDGIRYTFPSKQKTNDDEK